MLIFESLQASMLNVIVIHFLESFIELYGDVEYVGESCVLCDLLVHWYSDEL